MPKSIDQWMADLDAVRHQPLSDETIETLRKSLAHKSNFIAAKAVAITVGWNAIAKLRDAMKDAFTRFIGSNDKGCAATTAIAKALAAERVLDDEAMFLAGAVHVQMEPVWGGSVDAAVELRCESVAALVRMNSKKLWDPLVRLFADESPQARSTAARALAATG